MLTSLPAKANDACPNVAPAMAARKAAHHVLNSSQTTENAVKVITATIKASTAYMQCATKWAQKSKFNEGWAEYNAAVLEFEASKDEQAIGQEFKADLESAWENANDTVSEIPPSATELLALAKRLRTDIEHYQNAMKSK